jgi:release factor glutamine methyltransferase
VNDPLADRLRVAGCVFAEDEAALLRAEAAGVALEALVARRVSGEPLETVLGWAELDGVRVAVDPGCFVPRQRTVLLARLAVAADPTVIVELCCGVAPVATLVAASCPHAEVHAADVDLRTLAPARRNLPRAQVHQGDLYDALPAGLRGRVDVLAANAPYVPTAEIRQMPREARDHEPLVALDGGTDGLDLHRRIAAGATTWLRPGGVLLIETSVRQAPTTAAICVDAGLHPEVVRDEELDATAVRAHRPTGLG